MKRILMSVFIISAVSVTAFTATQAYFSDVETSTGNTFTAGTLDLTLSETDGAPIYLTEMQPGDEASGTIIVTNIGNSAGWLGARSAYGEADGDTTAPDGTGVDMDEDKTAKMLLITAFTADTVDILTAIPDVDTDGRITVYDMVNDPSAIPPPHAGGLWYSYDTNMEVDEEHIYSLTVEFDENAGNDYQGDGIVWTFEFLLDQQ